MSSKTENNLVKLYLQYTDLQCDKYLKIQKYTNELKYAAIFSISPAKGILFFLLGS